ncbi:hypothetical protein ACWDYH_39010 [Nocardia goodfellowii]
MPSTTAQAAIQANAATRPDASITENALPVAQSPDDGSEQTP